MNGRLWSWLALSLGVLSLNANSAEPNSPAAAARASFNRLGTWLDRSATGPGWKAYLRWSELAPVVAGSAQPDPNLLADVVQRLQRPAPGLDRSDFTRFRGDLDRWLVDLTSQTFTDLPAAIRGQVETAKLDPARIQSAHKTLRAATTRLNAKLQRTAIGQKWIKSLGLKELQSSLAGDAPLDGPQLRAIQSRFTGSTPGLEWDGFKETRDALERYAGLVETVGAADAETVKAEKLKALADAVAGLGEAPDAPARHAVDEALTWVARSEAAPAVVRAVRAKLSHPNLHVRVSPGFLNKAVARPVDEVNPISEYILETRIRGTGRTIGNVAFDVLPDSEAWKARFRLEGTSYGRTIGRQGPATIYGHSTTYLTAEKVVKIDEQGVSLSPTVATAQANPVTDSINVDVPRIIRHLATRVANRKASESRGQAKSIASSIARRRITEKFDSQFVEPVAKGNAQLRDNLFEPLARLDATPELDFNSGNAGWTLAAVQTRSGQIAAPNAPPELDAPIELQLHETLVQRIGDLYAGQTVGNEQIKAESVNLFGKVPSSWSKPKAAAPDEEEDVPGTVTFDDVNPLDVNFRGGKLKVVLRSKRFTRGDRIVENPMTISVTYRLTNDGNHVVFHREDLLAMPSDAQPGQKLPLSATLNKNLVEKGFKKAFPEEIRIDPRSYFEDVAKFGEPAFTPIVSENGWISVGMVFPNVKN